MKIAFDENMPHAMVRVFQTFTSEKSSKKLVGNFEILSAKDFTPAKSDADYVAKNDVPWIKRFHQAGGRVIISGNTEMKNVPHERLALIECGMLVIFFEPSWNNWGFFKKCAHLMHWWPVIAAKARSGKKGKFWHVPLNWQGHDGGKLRAVSNRDPKELKLEQQAKSKETRIKKQKGAKSIRKDRGPLGQHDDLFQYASRPGNGKKQQ